jgi:hypothetical protein
MFYSFTVKEAYLKYIRDACMLNAVIPRRDNSVILQQRVDFNAPMQYNCPQIMTEPMQCSCTAPMQYNCPQTMTEPNPKQQMAAASKIIHVTHGSSQKGSVPCRQQQSTQ